MCKDNMKCSKISIRAGAVCLVSIMTWIPTIFARNLFNTDNVTVIKATEYVFYLNTFFDPMIYIFGERVLNMIPWLNPPSSVKLNSTTKSNQDPTNGGNTEMEL